MNYSRQGFAIIEKVLCERDLLMARALVANLVERHRRRDPFVQAESVSLATVTRQHPQRNPDMDFCNMEDEPFIIGNLISLDTRFARLFCIEALWITAARFLRCTPGEVVFHFANVTRKPALNGPAIGWHRDADNAYFSSNDHRTLRLLLPLEQMSINNGGTSIVTGSHLPGARQTTDDENLVCIPIVVPGSCLALHSQVLHGGSPNRSASERDVIILRFGVITSELKHHADEVLSLSGRDSFINYVTNSVF